MSDPKLDEELREYLDYRRKQRSDGVSLEALDMKLDAQRATLATIADRQASHEREDVERHTATMGESAKTREKVEELAYAYKRLYRKVKEADSSPAVGPRPSSPDDSGSIDLAVLKTRLEEREERRKESATRAIAIVAAAISFVGVVAGVILQLVRK